ncbi:uncharacterized protein LOC131850913 isoform X1 [Achroia grisella]|uniref:uncharacterized protein LOC131850913 isoform X1 n=1 Tax=Achroia grisella TaxID=688607 RepID=UPI0027D31172|nr:uncharacterized protein LOC131850913 isoform X1 [Achroia grisella]
MLLCKRNNFTCKRVLSSKTYCKRELFNFKSMITIYRRVVMSLLYTHYEPALSRRSQIYTRSCVIHKCILLFVCMCLKYLNVVMDLLLKVHINHSRVIYILQAKNIVKQSSSQTYRYIILNLSISILSYVILTLLFYVILTANVILTLAKVTNYNGLATSLTLNSVTSTISPTLILFLRSKPLRRALVIRVCSVLDLEARDSYNVYFYPLFTVTDLFWVKLSRRQQLNNMDCSYVKFKLIRTVFIIVNKFTRQLCSSIILSVATIVSNDVVGSECVQFRGIVTNCACVSGCQATDKCLSMTDVGPIKRRSLHRQSDVARCLITPNSNLEFTLVLSDKICIIPVIFNCYYFIINNVIPIVVLLFLYTSVIMMPLNYTIDYTLSGFYNFSLGFLLPFFVRVFFNSVMLVL